MKTTRLGFSTAPKKVDAKRSARRNDRGDRFMKVKRFGGTNKVGHRKVTEDLGRFEIHILKDDSFNLAMQVIP
tara:strand:+ start:1122 stop:1340 length:219 start_codon:yes stop_codon:yes gene_type:complete